MIYLMFPKFFLPCPDVKPTKPIYPTRHGWTKINVNIRKIPLNSL